MFLVGCLTMSTAGQDASGLDALFRQAAERETGSAKDSAGAARLYAEAARQGHTPSMVRLGFLLQSGVAGVPKDEARAFEFFTRAAKANNLDGAFMLAMSYLYGVGTTKDPAAAREWLRQPAGANHQYSQYLLGVMLESGEGGERREAASRRWLDRAASGPDTKLAARAAALRDKVDQNMLAPDNHNGIILTAILAMAMVGMALQGGTGGLSVGGPPGRDFGGGPGVSAPPCRPVPMPMVGTSMTLNGSALSNPGPGIMMGGC